MKMKIERRRTIRRCTEEVYLRVGERGKLEKLLRVEEMLRFFSFLFFLSLNFDSRRSIRVDVDFPREGEREGEIEFRTIFQISGE